MEIPTLKGKLIISGYITTETGLHIGGISETLKIGGVDIQVIKDPLGRTYIPGSSLKGKIRSLLEVSEKIKEDGKEFENYTITAKFYKIVEKEKDGKKVKEKEMVREVRVYNIYDQKEEKIKRKMDVKTKIYKENSNIEWIEEKEKNYDINELKLKNGEDLKEISSMPCSCGGCDICKIFGPHNSKNIIYPRRVIVRDAFLINEKTGKILTKKDENYDDYFEIKMENTIDRIKGTALNPRQIERVVKGSKFKFEIIFNVFNEEEDIKLIKKFIKGIELLEDDYLGGCGSRGYGKVKFENLNIVYRPKEYYEKESSNEKENIEKKPQKDTINNLNELKEVIDKLLINKQN